MKDFLIALTGIAGLFAMGIIGHFILFCLFAFLAWDFSLISDLFNDYINDSSFGLVFRLWLLLFVPGIIVCYINYKQGPHSDDSQEENKS